MTKRDKAVPDVEGPIAVAVRSESQRWWPVAILLGLFCGAFLLLWPTAQSLVTAWEDIELTTYTHGYLIVAISAWLLFRDRDLFASLADRALPLACVPLAMLSLLWLICVRAGIQTGHQVLLPVLLWLAVLATTGLRAARATAFAIGYLYFAIPVWGSLTGILQDTTVAAVDLLLRITGVTAYVQGNVVELAAGTFVIEGGCSGLHFFIVGVALSVLYGEVHRDSWRNRALLVLLAVGLALVTNWLRVYIIILAGYLTDMQHYLVRVEHYRFGWVIFAITMIAFFLIARRLPVAPPRPQSTQADISTPKRSLFAVALALGALAFGPLWNLFMPVRAASLPSANEMLPRSVASWTGPDDAFDTPWKPVFNGADQQQFGRYSDGARSVEVYVADYATQAQGRELVGYDNSVVGAGAETLSEARDPTSGPAIDVTIRERDGSHSAIRYFYRVGGLRTDRGTLAQVWYGVSSLVGAPRSSIVAMRAECRPDCAAAQGAFADLTKAGGF
jgi:exosortase A